MVTVRILLEGGSTDKNADADTMDNSAALRESLSQLLSSGVSKQEVSIEAIMQGSYMSAVKAFQKDEKALLLIDLDANERTVLLQQLQLLENQNRVFFMVQAMEAWILSQPDKLETRYAKFKINTESVADYAEIAGIPTYQIPKPDAVLNRLLQHFFELPNGKKQKYRKLKNSYEMIAVLDVKRLATDFEDVKALLTQIEFNG
jgi:anion-transporting  ArsA/GET3 family ATPase